VERIHTFASLILYRLPRELRILLAHEDSTALKLMAAKADALHTHNKGSSGVNAMGNAEVNADVNAVAARGDRLANGQGCNRGGSHQGVGCGSRRQAYRESGF
jgi:hypothetical protein